MHSDEKRSSTDSPRDAQSAMPCWLILRQGHSEACRSRMVPDRLLSANGEGRQEGRRMRVRQEGRLPVDNHSRRPHLSLKNTRDTPSPLSLMPAGAYMHISAPGPCLGARSSERPWHHSWGRFRATPMVTIRERAVAKGRRRGAGAVPTAHGWGGRRPDTEKLGAGRRCAT